MVLCAAPQAALLYPKTATLDADSWLSRDLDRHGARYAGAIPEATGVVPAPAVGNAPDVEAAAVIRCCGERGKRVTTRNSYRNCTATEIAGRSEEHTSELQSQSNLVCRLLL